MLCNSEAGFITIGMDNKAENSTKYLIINHSVNCIRQGM